MAWVYISIAVGAAGFLIWIIIEFLKDSATIKPKVDRARLEIRECEMQIESEQAAAGETKQEVEELHFALGELEKELTETGKKVEEYRDRERRRKPTKFKVED